MNRLRSSRAAPCASPCSASRRRALAQPAPSVLVRVAASPGSDGQHAAGRAASVPGRRPARAGRGLRRASPGRSRHAVCRQGQVLAVLSAPELDAKACRGHRHARDRASAPCRGEGAPDGTAGRRGADSPTPRRRRASLPGRNSCRAARTRAPPGRGAAAEASVAAPTAAADATRRTRELPRPHGAVCRRSSPSASCTRGRSPALAPGPVLRLAQVTRLRLVVAVPEVRVASMRAGHAR